MKRCVACHTKKPDAEFPAPGSLTCTFCSPPLEAVELVNRIEGNGTGFDKAPSYDMLGNRGVPSSTYDNTHSLGIRPHPHNKAIAKSLLNIAGYKSHVGSMAPPINVTSETVNLPDDRPLIDKLHEATFTNPPGLQWHRDLYELRMTLRKARCFTLDKTTSALVADFSMAIAEDLELSRRMAIPPFPVTWIDIDNRARLARVKDLGIALTPTAAGETDAGPAVERVGWLIRPAQEEGAYFATYVTEVEEGIMTAPMPYWWRTGEARPAAELKEAHRYMQAATFGIRDANVHPYDACIAPSASGKIDKYDKDMMDEIAGELRHIWGFLIALGAGQLGMEASYSPQDKPLRAPPTMKNGKPLLPLEHKVLHLHLAKRMTVEKVIARSITHHRHRWHEVRSHFRLLKSGKRVPVKSHERGDERLGRIEKSYSVEK